MTQPPCENGNYTEREMYGVEIPQLVMERLFRDFAQSIQDTANAILDNNQILTRVVIPSEELNFWCGHIKGALSHDIPSKKPDIKADVPTSNTL